MGKVTYSEPAPEQLELPFPKKGEFHFEVGDLVMFASLSGKWNHLRQVRVVDMERQELHTENPGGAIQIGRPNEPVKMEDVLGHWRQVGEQ